ncbi:MAG TPA: nitroreductase/quinone reductase family protein [Anaerolineales bacterium]|nr:nitroreductase/quinone reductase family protein [Anaerolineales bacterium]
MISKKYNPFQALVLRISASKLGAWLLARSLHHFDTLLLRWSRGRVNLTSLLTGAPVVHVTTTGAKSGLPRSVPLLCIRDEKDPQNFALIATNFGQKNYPAWYFNLKAHPHATCSIGGDIRHYLAHEASGEEYARFWEYAASVYIGYPLYKQRIQGRRVPILVMIPLQ